MTETMTNVSQTEAPVCPICKGSPDHASYERHLYYHVPQCRGSKDARNEWTRNSRTYLRNLAKLRAATVQRRRDARVAAKGRP